MATQHHAAGAAEATGTASAVITIGILAIVLNYGLTIAQMHGYSISIPIDILGGFSFRVAPLLPLATALILAFGLWRFSGVSQGRAWIAALFLFIAPILFVQVWNALTGWLLNMLPDSVVTNSQNFYGIFFVQRAVSAASVLLVMAIAAQPFRSWAPWIWAIVIWAGGDTLLFGLYRNEAITMGAYQWLYPLERTLGFFALAFYFHGSSRAAA